MILLKNQLSLKADYWLHELINFEMDIPANIPQEILSNRRDLIELMKNIALEFWINIDRQNVSPSSKLDKQIPLWVVFILPRRPATVYYSLWIKKSIKEKKPLFDYLGLTDTKIFERFVREHLYLFKSTYPFRKKLGLKVSFGKRTTKAFNLPEYLKSTLTSYSTPMGVLNEIATFVHPRTLQAGVSLVRSIERLSSEVNKADDVTEIVQAFGRFQKSLMLIKKYDQAPTIPPDVDITKAIEPIKKSLKGEIEEELGEIEEDISEDEEIQEEDDSEGEKKEEDQEEVESSYIEEDPVESRKIKLMSMHQDDIKNFPSWKKEQQSSLILKNKTELFLYLCSWKGYSIIASKARTLPAGSWRQDPKYFKWFKDPQKARKYYSKKLNQKLKAGYQRKGQ